MNDNLINGGSGVCHKCGQHVHSNLVLHTQLCGKNNDTITTASWPRVGLTFEEIERLATYEPVSGKGAAIIATERHRQMSKEGWSEEHDDTHVRSELLHAAVAYTQAAIHQGRRGTRCDLDLIRDLYWPWAKKWWKPSDDPIRNLVKAGALIAAEIDRLQRIKK